jgi:hypothetical protein
MERPLQAILIAGEKRRDEVLARTKTTTIRLGFRDYVIGAGVMIGCHVLNWCIMRTITDVHHCFLKDLPVKYMQDNGYKNLNETIDQLGKIYPGINGNSQVTFVRWV